ncbi:MAG: PhoH family protein, partial [Gammaproteobacteria bacterium]
MSEQASLRLELQPDNPQRLASLCGRHNEHLHQIEERLDLRITNRGNAFQLIGTPEAMTQGSAVLESL